MNEGAPVRSNLMKTDTPKTPRPGMTLVEIMVSMVIFSIAILGTIGVFTFGLQSVDESRSFAQVTRILNHEMESMRIRQWSDRTLPNGVILHGLKTFATAKTTAGADLGIPPGGNNTAARVISTTAPTNLTGPKCATSFSPFAVYGVAPTKAPASDLSPVAIIGRDIDLGDANLQTQYLNAAGAAAGFTCTRTVEWRISPLGTNYAEVGITVTWKNRRGMSHTRSQYTTMSEDGLNKVVYEAVQ